MNTPKPDFSRAFIGLLGTAASTLSRATVPLLPASVAVAAGVAAAAVHGPTAHGAPLPSRRCDSKQVAYDMARPERYADYAARARRRDCYKPWTILVYMAADNDLAPYAYFDLFEMERGYKSGKALAGSTARTDLLVQLNGPASKEGRRIHVFQRPSYSEADEQVTPDDFREKSSPDVLSPDAGTVPLVGSDGKSVAAATDFERFVEWGLREYPAEHTMVVVWGHGQGWAPASAKPTPLGGELEGRRFGGLAFSDTQGTFLSVPSLRQALRLAETRAIDGRAVDVYASDACLMQMAEVADEMADSARFIVGSSQVENFLGMPYRTLLHEIVTGDFDGERKSPAVAGSAQERDEAYLLARMLPRLFRKSLDVRRGLHGRRLKDAIATVTMSALSSQELRQQLVPALGGLARALKAFLEEAPLRAIAVRKAMLQAPSFMGGSQELGGFLRLLDAAVASQRPDRSAPDGPAAQAVRDAIARAQGALDRTVTSYALGTRYTGKEQDLYLLGFRALALWLPSSKQELQARLPDFASSRLYRELGGSWQQWMQLIYP